MIDCREIDIDQIAEQVENFWSVQLQQGGRSIMELFINWKKLLWFACRAYREVRVTKRFVGSATSLLVAL